MKVSAYSESALVGRLRAAGCVFAEDEARLLLDAAETPPGLEAMVEQRVSGLPLEQILGWAEFCGLRIVIEPGVFVPRRRTELLTREAAGWARGGSVVVDLCCGSGAVGAVLASMVSGIELHAVDVEPAAVHCARRNLAGAGSVYEGDLYEPLPLRLRGRINILVVNAPYVPTEEIRLMPPEARIYEPRTALDGGADGLDFHRRIATAAPQWLSPRGCLLIETSERQAAQTADIVTGCGLSARVATSEELDATVVVGIRPNA